MELKSTFYSTRLLSALFFLLTFHGFSQTYNILNNGLIRSGNGAQNSVNTSGNLNQPWYFNGNLNTWYKLTYSSYPLDIRWGVGGDGTSSWNTNGSIVENPGLSSQFFDYSGHTTTNANGDGYGVIKTSGNITINGQLFLVENTYNLPQGQGYIEIKTKLTNISATNANNIRLWVSTRDDWVGNTDAPNKTKGNIVNGTFTPITIATDQAKALKVSTGTEAVLFYSNSPRAYTTHAYCCSFSNATNVNPYSTSGNPISQTGDGSYALFVRFNDLAPNQSDEIVWYYAAGTLAQINNIVSAVAQASGSFQNKTCTGAVYNATSNVAATGYWVIVPNNAVAPTAAQIKAAASYGGVTIVSSGNATMPANTSTPFTISGLQGQNGAVDYDYYFVTESPDPNNANATVFSSVIAESLTTDDNVAPTVVTQNISVTLDSTGHATIQPSDIDNGSSDNCATNLTYSLNKSTFTCADGASQTVTLSVTDAYGNIGTGTAVVTITNSASTPISISNSLCGSNNGLLWATWNNVTSTTGQGTFGNLGVTVSVTHSAGGLSTTSGMFNHSAFPTQFSVPNTTSLRNDLAGTFTFCFSQPVENPQVAFASIGNPSNPVSITSSVPYQIVWNGQSMTYNNSSTFTGAEGFTIVSFPGTHQCITLQYAQSETYANLAFGFENYNCNAPQICPGDAVTLTATGGNAYEWSPSTGLSATNTGSVIATPSTTTTYTVIDPLSPCRAPQTITINVSQTPTAPATADQSICVGTLVSELVATVPSGQSVRWYTTPTGGTALASTSIVTPGTYYAEAVDLTCGVSPTRTQVELSYPVLIETTSGSPMLIRGFPELVDSTLVINETNPVNGALVTISSGFVSGDILDYPGTLPSGVTKSYNASSGILTLNGTLQPADLQTILRGITINTTSMNGQNRTVTFNLGSALPSSSNGHFYQFVNASGISWTAAKLAAQQLTLYGMQGYLATVTSSAENQFIAGKLNGQGWMGASDATTEGVWKWETGPEVGQQFWQGTGSGNSVSGRYNNWNSGEPNNSGNEDYAHFRTDGTWNDFPLQVTSINGYVVEFGGMPNDPCVVLTGERVVNVTISTPPVVTINTQFTVTNSTIAVAGEVTYDGNATVTDRGFVLSTSPNPTTADTKLSVGTGMGVFNGTLTGLQPSTMYYVRAFATNYVTTSYGNEISFYTRPIDLTNVTSSDYSASNQANVICEGTSTTLSATGISGTVYWYTSSCGGAQIGTGDSIVVSPSTTTTYYARNFNNNLFSDNCISIEIVVRPALVAPVITGAETICWSSEATGLTGTQATGGSSLVNNAGFAYQWQLSEDSGITWQNMLGETNYASLLPGYLYTTTQFRLLATDLGIPSCYTELASNVITVVVRDPFTPSVVSIANTNNTTCFDGDVQLTATPTVGGSGPQYLYQWQYSTDSINWLNLGAPKVDTTDYVDHNVTVDTYYRLIAFDMGTPGCGSVFSINTAKAVIQTAITEGDITGAQHICAETVPAVPISNTTAGTGRGTISYRWEVSTDGGSTWNTIVGATTDYYQPGVLHTTSDFRRFTVSTVNGVACESVDPTNVVQILVDQLPIAEISDTAITTCVSAAVNVPGVNIQYGIPVWTHNGHGILSGSNAAPVYQPDSLDAGTTVTLTLAVTGTTICADTVVYADYVIHVEHLPEAYAGGSTTICENSSYTISDASSAHGSILWTHNGAGNLQDATTITPTYFAAAGDAGNTVVLTLTVSSINTCTPQTAVATYAIDVDQLPLAIAGGRDSICSQASTTVYGASSARGTILWSHNGTGNIVDETTLTPTYTAGAADAGRTVVLTMTVTSTNVCGPQTDTATFTVVVRPDFVPATFVNQDQDLCYNTSASQITATPAYGGTGPYAYQWQMSTDSINWNNIAGATGLTYTPSGLYIASRYYRILSTDLGTPSCGNTLAGAGDMMLLVRNPLTPPSLPSSVTICDNTFTTLTPQVAIGGRNNFTYQWQQSLNGTTGWTNIGTPSTNISYTTPVLTSGIYYRVIARDQGVNNLISCGSTYSQPIHVIVASPMTAGVIAGDETICVGNTTTAITSVSAATGSGIISYRWEFSIDSGATWTTIPNETAATLSPGAIAQTTQYRRYGVSTFNGNTCESAASNVITKVVQQLPVFTISGSNLNVNTDPGMSTALVSYAINSTAVTPITTTYTFSGATTGAGNGTGSGSLFNIGTTEVTITATTTCGFSTSIFDVVVVDNELPVIVVGNDLTISTSTATTGCAMPLTVAAPSATDNSTSVSVTYAMTGATMGSGSAINNASFNVGVTTIIWTAVDPSGNSVSDVQLVEVIDAVNPLITGMPTNIQVNAAAGLCTEVVTWNVPSATDECGIASFTSNYQSGDVFAVGTTTVEYTAEDVHGNISTQSFDVIVVDNQDPLFSSMPANITVTSDANACGTTVQWTLPTITDNCGIATTSSNYSSGQFFGVGSTRVVYTATDIHGNTDTAGFWIFVQDLNPIIVGTPGNQTLTNNNGICGAVATWVNPTVTDNCTGATLSSNYPSGSTFPVGTTSVIYTATDVNGNSSTSTFTITVLDNEQPIWSNVPANITIAANANACNKNVSWIEPVVSDNCTAQPTITKSHAPGSLFALGTTTVSYTAIDAAGNSSSVSFTVTVVDQTAPVIAAVTNITKSVDAATCGSNTVNVIAPIVTDQCNTVTAIGTRSDNLALNALYPVGTTTITWNAIDAAGNAATPVVQLVNIIDTIAPYVVTQLDSVVYLNDNSCSYYWENWRSDVMTVDNCGNSVTLSSASPQNLFLNKGFHTIVYSIADSNGNNRTYNHQVEVRDTIKPLLTNMPTNKVIYASSGCGAYVTWVNPTPSDNCVGFVMTSNHQSGDWFSIGTTPVNFTVTDASGLITTGGFTVTILDTLSPVFVSVPSTVTIAPNPGSCSAVVNWNAPVVTDNCSFTISTTQTSGSTFNVGTHTVVWTAADAYGNSTTAALTFTVSDTEAPLISNLPSTITLYASNSNCSAVGNWSAITATDNCGQATVSTSVLSGSTFAVGNTIVNVVATDTAGNSSNAAFIVNVLDTISPVWVSTPQNITTGSCANTVNYIAPTATDNCSGVNVVQIAGLPSGSIFPIGITTNTFAVTDSSGNSSFMSFTVTVTGTSFTYQQSVTEMCESDLPLNLMPTGITGLSFSGNGVAGSEFDPSIAGVGVHLISFVYTDTLGCQSTGSFNIEVNETPVKPTILRMTSVILKVTQNYSTYQWRRYGIAISGANQSTYTVTQSGIYDVVVTNGTNCSNTSDPFGFGVTIGEEELSTNEIRVQPNPNNGHFSLVHSMDISSIYSVKVVDMFGRMLMELPLNDVRLEFDLSQVAQGTYMVVVETENGVTTLPVVIQY